MRNWGIRRANWGKFQGLHPSFGLPVGAQIKALAIRLLRGCGEMFSVIFFSLHSNLKMNVSSEDV